MEERELSSIRSSGCSRFDGCSESLSGLAKGTIVDLGGHSDSGAESREADRGGKGAGTKALNGTMPKCDEAPLSGELHTFTKQVMNGTTVAVAGLLKTVPKKNKFSNGKCTSQAFFRRRTAGMSSRSVKMMKRSRIHDMEVAFKKVVEKLDSGDGSGKNN